MAPPLAQPQRLQTVPCGQPPPTHSTPQAGPPNGAYSVITGGQRHYVPFQGSKTNDSTIVQAQSNATAGHYVLEQRPSWARPDASPSSDAKGRDNVAAPANAETEELKVQRQLEAELQAQ